MEFMEFLIVIGLVVWVVIIIINKSNNNNNNNNDNTTTTSTSTTSSTSTSSNSTTSSKTDSSFTAKNSFAAIADKYKTFEEVQDALRAAGLESSNLIIGVDYTKSNEYTGKNSFQGKSLHYIDHNDSYALNPYQQVICALGRTLESFDDDKQIPAYGFGDITTSDKKVFPFIQDRSCCQFTEVLEKYNEITPVTVLSGPTSFAPLIKEAIRIVKEHKSYHILVIIADGQVTSETETKNAIVEASNYALSIVLVGVGDGPWEMMREFDDGLPTRKFDNFQFVNATEFFGMESGYKFPDIAFSVAALQEIPDQFKAIRRLKLL